MFRGRWLAAPPAPDHETSPTLKAQTHNSGFPIGHDTYNGLSAASDGRIYYVLSTEGFDVGARMFVFDPATGKIRDLGGLTEACGEQGRKAIVQGKSHVQFVESKGKLYFATHVGYYSSQNGMETMGVPPAGYHPYPGGHLLAYEMATGKFDDLAIAPQGEGILTMNMDTMRGRIFGLTWPTGRFFRFNLASADFKDFGPVCRLGESGRGAEYRTICRSIAVDPGDGSAYYTDSEGTIHRYRVTSDAVEIVHGDDLKKDYFGLYDPTSPGHMGYNWRQVVWVPSRQDGLRRTRQLRIPVPVRSQSRTHRGPGPHHVAAVATRGMFDQFSYGYLGFTLGPDGRTLYYLTGGPVYVAGKRVAGKLKTAMGESKGIEDLHLVTWDIATGKYADHGAIFFADGQRPSYVNSIAVGHDGTVYASSRITENGKTRTDLMSIPAAIIGNQVGLTRAAAQ